MRKLLVGKKYLSKIDEAPEFIKKMCADPEIANLYNEFLESIAKVNEIYNSYDPALYCTQLSYIKELEKLCRENMREGISTPATQAMKRLISLDGTAGTIPHGKNSVVDSHNAYVLYVLGGKSIPGITQRMRVDKRTVFKYLDQARERMKTLLYGIYGIPIKVDNTEDREFIDEMLPAEQVLLNADRHFRNTEYLLRNYRVFRTQAENVINQFDDIITPEGSSTNLIMPGKGIIGFVESIKLSAARTATIVKHIELMMKLYQSYCFTLGSEEDQRRWRVVNELYIRELAPGEQPITIQKLAEEECKAERTIYKDIHIAEERIAVFCSH